MSTLEDALTAHREAAARFLSTAGAVPKQKWPEPIAAGKWSPAQIADHVAISTEVGLKIMRGEKVVPSVPRFLQFLPRLLMFRPTLKKQKFPGYLKAPGAFKPAKDHPALEASAAKLDRALTNLEAHARDLARAGTYDFDHPFLGRIPVADALRFMRLHVDHHERQLRDVGLPPT